VRFLFLFLFIILLALPAGAGDEYEFDASRLNKPFEVSGYLEHAPVFYLLNQDSALYKVRYCNLEKQNALTVDNERLLLQGEYRKGMAHYFVRTFTDIYLSPFGGSQNTLFYDAYGSFTPSTDLSVDVGKRNMRWGKGYAWTPVAFLDRPKNPEDPELPLEGITVLSADFTRTFSGRLKTVTFTPVIVPVYQNVNEHFGILNHCNVAGKLYLLYDDTDIDLIALTGGSKSLRYGFDFSRNLASNLEIHGEYAHSDFNPTVTIDGYSLQSSRISDFTSYLLGARYQTIHDTTFILEYYRNGAGFTAQQMNEYYSYLNNSYDSYRLTGSTSLLSTAQSLQMSGYGTINPMQDYLYFRVSKKDAFNTVYLTPAFTTIYNFDDKSFALSPEVLYSPTTNVELRLKTIFNCGPLGTEFGEKPARFRTELRMRYYFDFK
jgi:hypothetical protein